jgi:RNA polymerase sigma-70 factor (ECF subfamily)
MMGNMAVDARFQHVLSAAREGEEWALAALYRSLQPSILGYLRGQRLEDAEDIASETWIAVARGLSSFDGDEGDFQRWVFTIARRRLIDEHRLNGRRPPVVWESAVQEAAGPDSETEALASMATREALQLVGHLPPDQAEIVVLRVIVGLSAEDVAAITGRTTVGVRVAQHRALGRLRSLLTTVVVTLQSRLAI